MEYWGHQRVESGESLDEVVDQILGDGSISGAILLVIVDLVLTHSPLNGEKLADLIASPEILVLDASRAQYDVVDSMTDGSLGRSWRGGHTADATVEENLSSRGSRTLALHDTIAQIIYSQPDEAKSGLRERLANGVARLGEWTDAAVHWTSPVFMASHALRLASKENYELVTELDGEGKERSGWSFRWPEAQLQWLQERSSDGAAE